MTPPSQTPPSAMGCITVDLDAIVSNWQNLARLVSPAECAAVVKANAYGLGAAHVVPPLVAAGCDMFFVATLAEAQDLCPLVPQGRVFVLNGVLAGTATHIVECGATPVLSTRDELALWRSEADRRGKVLSAALQIDTGLNRLGLSAGDVEELCHQSDALDGLDLVLVMSHLASADDPRAAENKAQLRSFETLSSKLPKTKRSLAASDGLMLGTDYHFDLVRPGYALYGGQAFQGGATPVNPVVYVSAKILQVRSLQAGDFVGYSATFQASHDMTIAIVAAGYADGVPRSASAATGDSAGQVAIVGALAPIVGRVSMDLIAVDVSHIHPDNLKRGQDVELIGPHVPLDRVGQAANTIGYEILTRLSPRFARVYLKQGETLIYG